jgi:hypothetical protein
MSHNTPDYAIEIHAKVLKYRFKDHALREAREHAKQLKRFGDFEGYEIWMAVGEKIVALIAEAKNEET